MSASKRRPIALVMQLGLRCGMLAAVLALTGNSLAESPVAEGKNADGKYEPGSAIGPYRGFGYDWENNDLGIDRNVPPPWTAIRVDGNTAKIWGREFEFSQALFPRRIMSQGVNLLAGPMRLRFGADGAALSDEKADTTITDKSHEDRIEFRGKLAGRSVDVALKTSLEFDGFLRFDLTISPKDRPVNIEELVVEIPLSSAVAQYFSRSFQYDFAAERALRSDIINSSGRISGKMATPFNHFLWIGNRSVGCELSIETNKNWSLADTSRALELEPAAKMLVWRVNIVTKPVILKAPMDYSFALYVNPIKPMPKNWRARITGLPMESNETQPDGYNPKLWTFSTTRIGPSRESLALPMPGLSDPPTDREAHAQYDRVRQKLKANGIRYIPYGALMDMHANVPELHDYAPFWLLDPEEKGVSPGPWKEGQTRKLDDKPGAGFGVSLYPKSIQDFLIANVVRSIEQWHQDGIFLDIGSRFKSLKDPKTGRLDIHRAEILYTPVFSVREFHKRLYKVAKSRKPDFLLTQHQAKTPVLYCGFSDIIYSGEALNSVFNKSGRKALKAGKLPPGHPPHVPDYSILPDEFWMSIYHQSFGFAQYFYPQVTKWNPKWRRARDQEFDPKWIQTHPDELARYTRTMLSRTVPLDVPLWRTRMDFHMYDKLMIGFEKFGGLLDTLVYIDPEESSRIRTTPASDRIVTSAYVRPEQKKIVLMIANWSDGARTDVVKLNFAGLAAGIDRIGRLTDIEDRPLPKFDENSVTVDLPPNDFRVLMIE